MTPFLKQIATLFYDCHGNDITDFCFVVPNRRAGVFFQYYLSEVAGKPLFSPTIITINELFEKLSPIHLADRVTLLFILYEKYCELNPSAESFDDFIFWGEMILGDFDDIDKYLADAQQVYTLINDYKEVDERYDYLSEDHIKAIRRFWKDFNPVGNYEHKIAFVSLWRLLHPLYESFRSELRSQSIGYDGMMMREVVENLSSVDVLKSYKQIVFVGLNALSKAEENLMKYLRKEGLADFYWDYDSPMVNDPDNRASHFVQSNKSNFPSLHHLSVEETENTQFELIGIPSAVGQTKQLAKLLETLHDGGDSSALKTAVVLPDESLLHPLLYAIPECYDVVNVTMGYPLKDTPIAALLDLLLTMHRSVRVVRGESMYYHKYVLAILNHRYVKSLSPGAVAEWSTFIVKNNKVFISPTLFDSDPSLNFLFSPMTEGLTPTKYLKNVIRIIQQALTKDVGEDEDDEPTSSIAIEKECMYHYYLMLNRMEDMVQKITPEMSLDTWFKMIRRMVASLSIPYRGEPLSGLQIMGVLETRALDFDNLIVLSMNDGMFPSKRAANTFIPFNIREGFGLPTYKLQDSVFAYHFYRLIHRAKRVYFFYDTRAEGLNSGEVSRYVHQLRYHYRIKSFVESQLSYDVTHTETSITIEKDQEIMGKLARFFEGGDRRLSASSINTYIDCPLKFFYSVVENIRETDEVSEEIEYDMFGTLFHRTMESLYSGFENRIVTSDLLKQIAKDDDRISQVIEYAFAKDYFKVDKLVPLKGRNFMIGEIIRNYVKKVLEIDAKLGVFTYLESERSVETTLPLENERLEVVQLKAIIDRLDRIGEITRVVDYKSGKADLAVNSLSDLFDPKSKDRRKAIMQVMLYSLVLWLIDKNSNTRPCIYSLRNIYNPLFNPNVTCSELGGQIENFAPFREQFTDALKKVLNEIFDPNVPFSQTEISDHCKYCDFAVLCRK